MRIAPLGRCCAALALVLLSAPVGLAEAREDDATTLVYPPFGHCLGMHRATSFHLFLYLGTRTRFNEPAFDAGRALYDGRLLGQPFRSVAKSFQARVWRDQLAGWDALPDDARARLEARLPGDHGLGHGLDHGGEVD